MIKVTLTNEILRYITEIEQNRYKVSLVKLSKTVMNKLRKNSKKKSSYASNKIEGNPLSEKQVNEVIESDERKHYLKPEQEVRNYFLALNYLEEKVSKKEKFSQKLILDVQKLVKRVLPRRKSDSGDPCLPGCCLPCMIPRREILIIFHRNIATYRSFWMNWWNM